MYKGKLEDLVQQLSRHQAVPGTAEVRWDEVQWDADALDCSNYDLEAEADIFVLWSERTGGKRHVAYSSLGALVDDLGTG